MTNVVTNLPMLSEEMLTDIQGGGKNGADLFLNGYGTTCWRQVYGYKIIFNGVDYRIDTPAFRSKNSKKM